MLTLGQDLICRSFYRYSYDEDLSCRSFSRYSYDDESYPSAGRTFGPCYCRSAHQSSPSALTQHTGMQVKASSMRASSMLSNESLLHASGAELIFSPTEFTFLQLSALFRKGGVSFSPGGVSFSPGGVSYSSVSTFATLLQSYFISAHRAHRFVSAVKLLFCYAVLKRIRSLMLMFCRNILLL